MSVQPEQTKTTLADAPDAPHDTSVLPAVMRSASVVRPSDVTEWLRMQGGKAHIGMPRLGADLGCSASRAHDEVRRLAASGVVRATPGARGTLLELMRPARPN